MAVWENLQASPLEVTNWAAIIQQSIPCSTHKRIWMIHALRHLKVGVLEQREAGLGGHKDREGSHRHNSSFLLGPSNAIALKTQGVTPHWANWKGTDSNQAWAAGTHWGWDLNSRYRAEKQCKPQTTIAGQRNLQMWGSPHPRQPTCGLPNSKILTRQIAKRQKKKLSGLSGLYLLQLNALGKKKKKDSHRCANLLPPTHHSQPIKTDRAG